MTTFFPSITDRKYGRRGASSHPVVEVCDIYYPDSRIWVKPSNGWPVMIRFQGTGFISSPQPDFASGFGSEKRIAPENAIEHLALLKGYAVMSCRMPVARGGATGNATGTGSYGAAYTGNGCIHNLPVYTQLGAEDQWLDDDWLMAPKSAIDAVQHARYNAAELGFDPNAIFTFGISFGGFAALWGGLAPDQIDSEGSGQRTVSSRANLVLNEEGPVWFPAYVQASTVGYMFADNSGSYNVPADNLSDTQPNQQKEGSLAWILTDTTNYSSTVTANDSVPVWSTYRAAASATWLATANRYVKNPSSGWTANVETDLHSVAQGYLLKSFLDNNKFVLGNGSNADSTAAANGSAAADETISSFTDRNADAIDYVIANLGQPGRKPKFSPARGTAATPGAIKAQAGASSGSGTTTGGASYVEIPANPDRAQGVYIQCTDTGTGGNREYLLVYAGDEAPADDSLSFRLSSSYTEAFAFGNKDCLFIPGQGAVQVKAESEATDVTYSYLEV